MYIIMNTWEVDNSVLNLTKERYLSSARKSIDQSLVILEIADGKEMALINHFQYTAAEAVTIMGTSAWTPQEA